jgi:outer membrane protein insertion porin family
MFLRLLKINIFLLLFSSITFAEVISKINISGNVRLTNETIKVLGGFEIDDDLNNNDLNKITKNLYDSDFFKDVNISLKDNILNIDVLENPIIQSIFIEGIKKKILLKS